MKTRPWIVCLILLSLTVGLGALRPPASSVEAADSVRAARQGAWL